MNRLPALLLALMMFEPVLNQFVQIDQKNGEKYILFTNSCGEEAGGMLVCYMSWPPGAAERRIYFYPTKLIKNIRPLYDKELDPTMRKTIQAQKEMMQ